MLVILSLQIMQYFRDFVTQC